MVGNNPAASDSMAHPQARNRSWKYHIAEEPQWTEGLGSCEGSLRRSQYSYDDKRLSGGYALPQRGEHRIYHETELDPLCHTIQVLVVDFVSWRDVHYRVLSNGRSMTDRTSDDTSDEKPQHPKAEGGNGSLAQSHRMQVKERSGRSLNVDVIRLLEQLLIKPLCPAAQ